MTVTLTTETRKNKGSNACKRLRKQGKLPCIVYGEKKDNVSVSVSLEDFLPLIKESVLKLKVDSEEENVIIKDIQYDSLGDDILHVDFLRIALDKKVTTSVRLQFVGTAAAVKSGGILNTQMREIEVTCLPHQVPKILKVDVEHLGFDDPLRVKDIKVTPGVEVLSDPEAVVAMVPTPRGRKAKAAEEEPKETKGKKK